VRELVVRCRALSVLAAVLALTAPVLWLAVPLLHPDVFAVDAALTAALAWALLGCWGWLAVASALMALEALATGGTRRSSRLAPRVVRTLVTAACGAGLAAGLAGPALADTAGPLPDTHLLDGLSLPDRATSAPARAQEPTITVRPGDTLFDLARAHDTTWPALYRANRGAIGADPDLVKPGTRLVVPQHPTHEGSQQR
jgi:hypothetical protein